MIFACVSVDSRRRGDCRASEQTTDTIKQKSKRNMPVAESTSVFSAQQACLWETLCARLAKGQAKLLNGVADRRIIHGV
jgi:hypothetical protein